jgi:general secretion pathway protein C
MNKRLPLLFTLLALILLVASIAYWALQLYKPDQRPLAPPPAMAQAEPSTEAAAFLFGGQPTAVAISNYQLTGVISAGPNSAVILVAEGAPPKAVRIGREIVPGVTVAEVHARYVMLSEGGVMKRVDLAPDTGAPNQMSGMATPPAAGPQPVAAAPAPGVEPQTSPGVVSAPPTMQSVPPVGGPPGGTPTTPENAVPAGVPEPQMDPGVQQATQPQGQNPPPPPNQVQMPPPTRSVNSPVGQPSQVQ